MSMGRTGSNYLVSHFNKHTYNESSNVYDAYEFFSMWPMHFYRHIQFLKENNLDIPKSFVEFMSRLVYFDKTIHGPKRFQWVAPHYGAYQHKDIEQKKDDYYLHHGWPYSLGMIDDFCEELKKLNCIDFFVHKHIARISDEFGDEWSYENVIDKADCIIVNYRYSVLDAFISLMKAIRTNQWIKMDTYDPDYDSKITWNKDFFIDYSINRYKASYDGIKKTLAKLSKPHFVVQYEDFTNPNTDRREYLNHSLLSTAVFGTSEVDSLLAKGNKIRMIKQSKPRKFYEDCFLNPEQFKKDYHEIKHLTTYKY